MSPDATRIRDGLRCAEPGCPCQRQTGNVHCPAHPDDSPSLSVSERDGHVLVKCHAGCVQSAVLAALRERGLWPQERRDGLTVEQLAEAKRLPVAFLRDLGVRTTAPRDLPRVHIPYSNEGGEIAAVRFRHALEGPARFTWRKGDHPVLYGLWRLREVRASGWCLLVEGESDTWTAWLHGLPALGIPGKGTWRHEWAQYLDGLEILTWQEPGAADLVERLMHALPDLRVIVPPDGLKDLSDAHVRGDDVVALAERLRSAARPAVEILSERREAGRRREAEEALRHSRGLLDNEHLLNRLDDALSGLGLAGDKRNARLLSLSLTSRLLSRPVNVAIEGPSAAGKNYLLFCVQALFPPEAVYQLTASSERLLAFTEEDLRHRVLVVGEASGLHHDGVGATILRTLAWEGRLIYETVEKTADGLRPRRIEKPGPTGLITTTTRALDTELATRLLTITVRDDPDQTRLVLRETGRRAANGQPSVDVGPFIAAQRWLAAAGVRDVVVPFAEILAQEVDAGTVRVRRDFTQLLTLIQASALLHQRQRPRDGAGRVLATLEDYRTVHAIASDLFAATITDDLTLAQRHAVDVVRIQFTDTGSELSLRQVAEAMGIDKSSASRRLARPLAKGYVLNVEDRRGRPGRYRPGEDLPNPRQAIPTPEDLAKAWGAYPPENGCNTAIPAPERASDEAFSRCSPVAVGGPLHCNTPPPATPPATVAGRISGDEGDDRCSVAVPSGGLRLPLTLVSPDGGIEDGEPLCTPEDLAKGGGRGRFILRLGEATAWAPCPYAPGRSITAGKRAWLTFIRANGVGELERAAAAMLTDPALGAVMAWKAAEEGARR